MIKNVDDAAPALEKAAEILGSEPSPRALSPIVYDAKTKLYVLFGGDHLDYLTNDTWVFDLANKKWEQRHPKTPRRRAPITSSKANGDGKVVLTGGYTYTSSTDYIGGQYRDHRRRRLDLRHCGQHLDGDRQRRRTESARLSHRPVPSGFLLARRQAASGGSFRTS